MLCAIVLYKNIGKFEIYYGYDLKYESDCEFGTQAYCKSSLKISVMRLRKNNLRIF